MSSLALMKKKRAQAEKRAREQEELDNLMRAEKEAAREKDQQYAPPPVVIKASKPRVWMDIEVGASGLQSGEVVGRVVFELFYDTVLLPCCHPSSDYCIRP